MAAGAWTGDKLTVKRSRSTKISAADLNMQTKQDTLTCTHTRRRSTSRSTESDLQASCDLDARSIYQEALGRNRDNGRESQHSCLCNQAQLRSMSGLFSAAGANAFQI